MCEQTVIALSACFVQQKHLELFDTSGAHRGTSGGE